MICMLRLVRDGLTGASVETVVGAGNLDRGDVGVDDPVLSTSAVAVVADEYSNEHLRDTCPREVLTSGREFRWP